MPIMAATPIPERLAELNEQAWGMGIGRRLRNDKGNGDVLLLSLGISL